MKAKIFYIFLIAVIGVFFCLAEASWAQFSTVPSLGVCGEIIEETKKEKESASAKTANECRAICERKLDTSIQFNIAMGSLERPLKCVSDEEVNAENEKPAMCEPTFQFDIGSDIEFRDFPPVLGLPGEPGLNSPIRCECSTTYTMKYGCGDEPSIPFDPLYLPLNVEGDIMSSMFECYLYDDGGNLTAEEDRRLEEMLLGPPPEVPFYTFSSSVVGPGGAVVVTDGTYVRGGYVPGFVDLGLPDWFLTGSEEDRYYINGALDPMLTETRYVVCVDVLSLFGGSDG